MPDSPVSLGLKGNGTGQRSLSLSAISLDRGKAAYDSPASTKTLTLSNTGNLTLTISKIDLTGDIDYYTLKAPSLPLVLGPGQSYGLYITYFAGVPGYDIDQYYIPATPHNATITLTDDAQDNSQNVQLLAVATSETITEIEDPSNVIWDQVALAPTFPTEISAPRYITITNVSFRPVVINALDFHEAIYNKKYAQYFEVIGGPSLPFTLQPGQVLKFSIAFNPQGNYIPEAYANLLIRYDSCHACLTLPHISASTLNPLKFDTTNLDFGDHPVGTITEKQFTVTNIGPKPYETLAQVVAYIDRGDYKPFRLKNADGLFDYANLNHAPGETRTFTIWCTIFDRQELDLDKLYWRFNFIRSW
ncbi:MAG TPA: choice-of-anchor D domain-containing protein [Chloroflexia bacterium]|nr:choice-of-anchor D domain-containing protein [Chloroflexia bacterium]